MSAVIIVLLLRNAMRWLREPSLRKHLEDRQGKPGWWMPPGDFQKKMATLMAEARQEDARNTGLGGPPAVGTPNARAASSSPSRAKKASVCVRVKRLWSHSRKRNSSTGSQTPATTEQALQLPLQPLSQVQTQHQPQHQQHRAEEILDWRYREHTCAAIAHHDGLQPDQSILAQEQTPSKPLPEAYISAPLRPPPPNPPPGTFTP